MPLAIDLFCGLGGWSEGLLLEGWYVIGFDIEQHVYGEHRYPAHLVIQDVLTLHGSQFRRAALIVASPPCQKYSYMAMPWKRAKAQAAEIRADETGAKLAELNRLFNACFRIQKEASIAAGRHIPMVVENVRGAIPWVGRSRWNFGSFHLWGDVPALMPQIRPRAVLKDGIAHRPNGETNFHGCKVPSFRFDGSGGSFQSASVRRTNVGNGTRFTSRDCGIENGTKQPGICGPRENGKGDAWFQDGAARHGSKSSSRKAASAMIAKIPLPLSRHIAQVYRNSA